MNRKPAIAYFSMEIALEPHIPTYAGGLGILAGDTIRAAADMKVPMIAVTLLHRKGYFFQQLDASGWQTESPVSWVPDDFLAELDARVTVHVDGHAVELRAWKYTVNGISGGQVPVILLDADLPDNETWHRTLTDVLYGGDFYYRLAQEIILGVGGVRMLRALGHTALTRFHMNEGHASLLTIELLDEEKRSASRQEIEDADIERVREQCIFTTHTPVEAGHDKFPMDVATRVIGLSPDILRHRNVLCCGDHLNMTYLALNLSHYVNGVAQKHGEVSRRMFQGYTIDSITNGVHPATWTAEPFQRVFDRAIPGWRGDSYSLRHVLAIPDDAIWNAHMQAKRSLIDHVNREANAGFDVDYLTLGFARRAAPYKRGALPVSDVARLKKIARDVGPIQIVFAGKAHPGDDTGKGIIQRIVQVRDAARPEVSIVYLENYDMALAALCTSGVDLWLNTPMPPLEASGTSGMKAALNGIPSLSILDGWWVEGCIEGVTGWAIGGMPSLEDDGRDRWESDAAAFYEKFEQVVAPMFYRDRPRYIDIMRHAIALNGSFFNTHRMVQQYIAKAYL